MPRKLRIDLFIVELNKLKEKYDVTLLTDDPFVDVAIKDNKTGEEYNLEGEHNE